MAHELREYQKESIKKLSKAFRDGFKHNILMVATGGGKTSIAASIIMFNITRNPNFKCLFIWQLNFIFQTYWNLFTTLLYKKVFHTFLTGLKEKIL